MLPLDVYHYIFDILDGDIRTQLYLKSLAKEFNLLPVMDLFNIDDKYKCNLTDEILINFKFIKLLDGSGWDSKITNNGIKHMTSLHTLDASCNKNITDEGI